MWDTMEYFDAINLEAIPRESNSLADELVFATSTMQLFDNLIEDKSKMEIVFRPSVPDNFEYWQGFDDERQIIRFLEFG